MAKKEKKMMSLDQLSNSSKALHPRFVREPLQQFYMAFSLYLLWCVVAWLSHWLGHLTISTDAGAFLLAGIAGTNALFYGIARASEAEQPQASAVVALQCGLGVVWATIFTYSVSASSDLALGMFMTATLFALFQVGRRTFIQLSLIAGLAYALAVLARELPPASRGTLTEDMLHLVSYLGVMVWIAVFAGHIHNLRQQLHDRNEQLRDNIRKVARVAERDHLTKSFNRHYIMETLAREKGRADRSNNPVSVCIFDLDHFKSMNDEHGHLVGDRVLKVFAKRVRTELRSMDAVNPSDHRRSFGRFGGEEFIAILPATGLRGAERCAERIRRIIADQPIDDVYRITVSAGVAEYRRGETVPELLARADEALYRAKAEGRNRVAVNGESPSRNAQILQMR